MRLLMQRLVWWMMQRLVQRLLPKRAKEWLKKIIAAV